MTGRKLERVISSIPASDGAGVKLRRSLGSSPSARLDPFLMLDEFFSDDPNDYLAGFPAHPHRGFETVTYMLDGHMRHEDNHGNTGNLGPGDVQWMRAARGIIHSEMPQQTEGRMRGFQLWLNLPAKEKMTPAAYRDIASSQIPTVNAAGGVQARIIAGKLRETFGPIHGGSTDPHYFDVHLAPRATLSARFPRATTPSSMPTRAKRSSARSSSRSRGAAPACCRQAMSCVSPRPTPGRAFSCSPESRSASRWCSTAPS
jgi:redox-sensitive bicupin YhaK (pirin superfamily)